MHAAVSIGPVCLHVQLSSKFTNTYMPGSGVHLLLASILSPRVTQICQETALSCLCYLQSGGHSVKSRKSLKLLLKSSYFTRLKMCPSLSRFRNRRHRHSSGRYLLDKEVLYSTWWSHHRRRPKDYINGKACVLVPLRFFRVRL